MAEGVRTRHARSCAGAKRCTCTPYYEATVWIAADQKKVRRCFPTQDAAKAWRRNNAVKATDGRLRAVTTPTLEHAAGDLLAGMRDGSIRARGGGAFRPPVIREYDSMLRRRVLTSPLAKKKLAHITTADLYGLVRDLHRLGLAPSSIRNTLDPIRVIFREAARLGLVPANPTVGLQLPTGAINPRTCSLTPSGAVGLVAALESPADRALWATALFAGPP